MARRWIPRVCGGIFVAVRDGGERMCADSPRGEDEHVWCDQVAPARGVDSYLQWDGVEDVGERIKDRSPF